MIMMKQILIAAVTMFLLAGCTTMKKMTGQTNDTVLPGAREEILPPDQQTARDPVITGQPQAPSANVPIANPPAATAPLKLPPQTAGEPACDPNVDLCPEALPPDPLPPPSVNPPPVKPAKVAMAKKPVVKQPMIIKKKKKIVMAKPVVPATPAVPAPPPPVPAPPKQ
jgi:Prokaryotic membrane lipoprotein lipid attachment site